MISACTSNTPEKRLWENCRRWLESDIKRKSATELNLNGPKGQLHNAKSYPFFVNKVFFIMYSDKLFIIIFTFCLWCIQADKILT